MAKKKQYEFLPDRIRGNWLHRLMIPPVQRKAVLKWGLYAGVEVAALLLQDVVFTQFSIFGGTVVLVPAVIFLVAVLQDEESGALFALLSALFYHFSGSAPGLYVVAVMPVLAVVATVIRESFLRRSFSSAWLCAGIALGLYMTTVFLVGVFLHQTTWSRIGVFLSSTVQGWAAMAILYPILLPISKIGADAWKE